MKNFDYLSKLALNEAPLSSYLKAAGSKIVSPSAYIRGAGKVLKGAGSAAGAFKTSSDYLSRGLTKAGQAASGVGTPRGLKFPEKETKIKDTATKQSPSLDYSKAKTSFIINNRSVNAKYAGSTTHGYPIYRIQGIPWAKSIIIEPKTGDKVNAYMYPDKKPNLKKQPSVVRSGSQSFSPVQNNLVITTK